jgi:signal transduction histidine kinase
MQDQISSPILAERSDDGSTAEADEIVVAWLSSLPRPSDGGARTRGVIRSCHALGRSVLRYVLDAPAGDAREAGGDDIPGLDRMIWAVAAANRRAGLGISQTLDDLVRLESEASRRLWTRAQETQEWRDALARTLRLTLLLGAVTSRLVHILEESALRSRREHSAALAAMTDMLSHELGNRLGAALTASEMLINPDIDLDARGLARAANVVRASVDAALHTVDDVRALAASRSRLDGPHPRSMKLPILVQAVIERLRSEAEEAGVDVVVDGETVACKVDAARLRLIIFNLVGNGIKYHDPDKERRTVRVSSVRRDDRVELCVADNGIGIPGDELADVFRYRRRGSEANVVPGSGLGLAIVREAVEQMDGEISVESEPGVGTCFLTTFRPLDEGGGRAAEHVEEEPEPRSHAH